MRIATKLRWFSLTIVVLTSLSVALVGYLGNSAIISDLQKEAMKMRASLQVHQLNLALKELENDIRFIHNLPVVHDIANTPIDDVPTRQSAKDELARIFEQMLKAKPDYGQIRFIGIADQGRDQGRELVRVDQRDGNVQRVAEAELQSKAGRVYVNDAIAAPEGEVIYSSINLNKEHGLVELPIRPVLRVSMPVYAEDHQVYGLVIINLNFSVYIDRVLNGHDSGRYRYYLLNRYGDFLVHPDPSQTFGFDLGFGLKADDEFAGLGEFLQGDAESVTFRDSFDDKGGMLVHFKRFTALNPPRELVFGIVASYDDVGRASWSITFKIVTAIGLLILAALLLTIRFSNKITKPLERITLATRSFANNSDESPRLPTHREDEIGDLANTFEEMKSAIERHQNSLLSANQRLAEMNRDLEHFANVASHHMREPIQRIAGLASLYQAEFSGATDDDASKIFEQLGSECEKALKQLADFREFTHITKDPSLAREDTLIEPLVRSVLAEFDDRLKKRQTQMKIDALPELHVYPTLVRVLYWNLVDNALNYAKEDGFLLQFTCEHPNVDTVIFGVENSSSKIDPNHFQTAFDIFRKLGEHKSGCGMGLAVSKRIVDFHGGRIWIESSDSSVHIKFTLTT